MAVSLYREADVAALERAWGERDAAALTELGTRLGLALDLPSLTRLAALARPARDGIRRRDVIATLLDAATGELGIAVYHWDRWLCLAVRSGDRVVVGIARAIKVSGAWPDLKPWQSDLDGNRKRLDAWAGVQADDRIAFAKLATGVRETPAPPNADELVRQIVASPTDRELRSVLADLLIEHDDVRGKLMRLHAEIDALPPLSDDRKKRELVVAQLVRQHGRRLAGEIADYANDFTIVAGFVDAVTMSAATFRDHGERLFRRQPIRRLKLQPANSATLATLAKGPVSLVRELHVASTNHQREIALAPLSRFDRLEVLELDGMAPIDDEQTFASLTAPLRSLVIRAHVSPATLRGLAANRTVCEHLETLEIRAWIPHSPYREADIRAQLGALRANARYLHE